MQLFDTFLGEGETLEDLKVDGSTARLGRSTYQHDTAESHWARWCNGSIVDLYRRVPWFSRRPGGTGCPNWSFALSFTHDTAVLYSGY
jgi:hypothetical protein